MFTLWFNPLKTNKLDFEAFLNNNVASFKNVEHDLVYVVDGDMKSLMGTKEYEEGWFYVMNMSSIKAVLALSPTPSSTVLDIAAAPGGKTALMAVLMNNTGSILANDISPDRIYKMKANLKRLGITNVSFSKRYGETLWRMKPNYFDFVLADVPCSMDERVEVTPQRIKSLVPRQKNLIWSGFTCLKVGGTMLYSTCTSSKEENEEVVNYLVEKEPVLCKVMEMKRFERDELMGTFFFAKLNKDT